MFLNVLNQDMSNIISDSSNPLHPAAAARLEPLHWPAGWRPQWPAEVRRLVPAKGRDLPVPLLGNCTATGAEGPGVHVLSAPSVVYHVRGCPKRTSSVVPCPWSHQLRALDSCASASHGGTSDDTPWNSSGIPSWEFHGSGDEQAVLRHPRRPAPRAEQCNH